MNMASVHPGSTVRCNVRGRIFDAVLLGGRSAGGWYPIEPPAGVTYRRVRARQVSGVVTPAEASGQMGLGISPSGGSAAFGTRAIARGAV